MTRLTSELHRLYLMDAPAPQGTEPQAPSLCDAQGRVRAMVLGLARPADWRVVSALWQGVQVNLGLDHPLALAQFFKRFQTHAIAPVGKLVICFQKPFHVHFV